MSTDRQCAIEDCNKPWWCRDWCQPHYRRWKDFGDPLGGSPLRPDRTLEERRQRKREQDTAWMRKKRASLPPGEDARQQREQRARNPEAKRETSRQWRAIPENRARELEQERARYAKDPIAYLARKREWREENPERWREYMHRSTTKRRGKECVDAWTWEEVTARDHDICQDCGIQTVIGSPYGDGRTIDHIVPLILAAPGTVYTVDDVETLCRSCNSRKWAHVA